MKPNPVNRSLARTLQSLKALAVKRGAGYNVTCVPSHNPLFGKHWVVQATISYPPLDEYMILTFGLSNPKSWEYTTRRASCRGSGLYRIGNTLKVFKSSRAACRYARAAFSC